MERGFSYMAVDTNSSSNCFNRLKNMIGSLQSNVNPSTIQCVAKSLGIVKHVCKVF